MDLRRHGRPGDEQRAQFDELYELARKNGGALGCGKIVGPVRRGGIFFWLRYTEQKERRCGKAILRVGGICGKSVELGFDFLGGNYDCRATQSLKENKSYQAQRR